MKIPVLLQIKIEIPNSNIDDAIKEFPTLRMYLQEFKRTRSGMFISEAEVLREEPFTTARDSLDFQVFLMVWEKGWRNCKVEIRKLTEAPRGDQQVL